MDIEGLASRLGIDREDFLELIELFISTTEADMEKIRKGMAENDPYFAAAAAHSIKGAAANLGVMPMAELAKKMEFLGKDGSLEGFEQDMEELLGLLDDLRHQLAH